MKADDEFLAACWALLMAMAGGPMLCAADARVLILAMPDKEMAERLMTELQMQPWVGRLV